MEFYVVGMYLIEMASVGIIGSLFVHIIDAKTET